MILREADYTLRAILYLTVQSGRERRVTTKEIAKEMCISYRFLRRIMKNLVDLGFAVSRRGKGGGLTLLKPVNDLSLLDLLKRIDPRGITLNECLLESNACERSATCPMHQQMSIIQDALEAGLAQVTFEQLARQSRENTRIHAGGTGSARNKKQAKGE